MLGTPWRHQGRRPGMALDCVGLVVCAARAAGWMEIPDRTDYDARPTGTELLEIVRSCCDEVSPRLHRGDVVVLWMLDRTHPQHLGIATGDDTLIHSWTGGRCVTEDPLDPRWRARIHSTWKRRRAA